MRRRVAIVGSGFAGSILAWVLARQGHRVTLLDRQRHPRFALGESTTPLAALSLERLAERYALPELHTLAAWGRVRRLHPELRVGRKRGFGFYRHDPGDTFQNDSTDRSRYLVAASPVDAIADLHWRRADVDAFLAARAVAAGVELIEEIELTGVELSDGKVELAGTSPTGEHRLRADLLVDGSGAGGFLAAALGLRDGAPSASLRTSLIYSHFAEAPPFTELARRSGARLDDPPYPEEWAAQHHLLEEGWLYSLRFDDGTVSAGLVLDHRRAVEQVAELDRMTPAEAWRQTLARYPTLAEQLGGATPLLPLRRISRLQRQITPAAGECWALLPHSCAFWSPLFSTGIAWSLLAVERLADLLAGSAPNLAPGLQRYGALLADEATFLGRLIDGAYRAQRDFDLFVSWCDLYFAAASFCEAKQRLVERPESAPTWAWEGFLGCRDEPIRRALDEASTLLGRLPDLPSMSDRLGFDREIRRLIEERNIAGLDGRRCVPVDFDSLLRGAPFLGLTAEEIRGHLPKLRGFDEGLL